MSTPALPIVVPPTPTRAMLLALGLVAAICGLIIVVAFEASLSSVKENRRVAMERATSMAARMREQIMGFGPFRKTRGGRVHG